MSFEPAMLSELVSTKADEIALSLCDLLTREDAFPRLREWEGASEAEANQLIVSLVCFQLAAWTMR
eukprot:12186991-Alexandrium_andersonii.AAC.1